MVGQELADSRTAGEEDAEVDFNGGEPLRREKTPCPVNQFDVRSVSQRESEDVHVLSSANELLFVVAARPMLIAAVIRPRPKMVCRMYLVRGFIFTFHSKKIGMIAVVISVTHEITLAFKSIGCF